MYVGGMANEVKTVNGPFYYIVTLYIYCILLYVIFLLIRYQLSVARMYRKQATLFIYSILIPMVINVFFQYFQIAINSIDHVDYTSLTFGLIAWMIYYSLFIYNHEKITEVVAKEILNKVNDGIILLDKEENIYYINERAEFIIGSKRQDILHQPVRAISSQISMKLLEVLDKKADVKYQIVRDQIYIFHIKLEDLADDKGRKIGRLFTLNDITAKETELVQKRNQGL